LLPTVAVVYWQTREQILILRTPAGFLLATLQALVLVPLSWWFSSRWLMAGSAVAMILVARYAGAAWSRRLAAREPKPRYLEQSINLVEDLGRWIGVSMLAWFVAGVAPLVATALVPDYAAPWAAVIWGLAVTAVYLLSVRKSRARLLRLPLALWVQIPVALLLYYFRRTFLGAAAPDSFEAVAYYGYWPVVAAGFVEYVVLGTLKPGAPAMAAEAA
ncbi:MAG TPA: hypothetical protein VGS99_07695, partial [Gammaproteobacteria bacterium]|nr:hypothetical protein [Gammaproteobacteria bacterium]